MTLPPGYDRRLTPANGRVADATLKGKIIAECYVEAEARNVSAVIADILKTPNGDRDRQLLRGDRFMALERQDNFIFGYAEKDGYVGWVDAGNFICGPKEPPTHYVSAIQTYGKSTPGLKEMGRVKSLPFGAQLVVLEELNGWSVVAWHRGTIPRNLFVPSQHLSSLNQSFKDPASVAELFLGTPYLWGGNSAFGIDCSGLVQAALLACNIPCPGDSDLQEAALGKALPENTPAKRGDLFFWKGHVAIAVDHRTLIHANAHHMAVACEPISEAIQRIQAQGDGSITSHRRIAPIAETP